MGVRGGQGSGEVPAVGRHVSFGIDDVLRATRGHSVLQDRSPESRRVPSRQPSKTTARAFFLLHFQFLYRRTGPEKATGGTRRGTKLGCGAMLLGAQGLRVDIFWEETQQKSRVLQRSPAPQPVCKCAAFLSFGRSHCFGQ